MPSPGFSQDGLVVLFDGGVEFAFGEIGVAEIGKGGEHSRIDCKRLEVGVDFLVRLAEFVIAAAEPEIRLGQVGF